MGGSAPSGGYCRVLLALPVPSLPSPPPSPPSPSGSGVTLIRGDLERRRLWGVRGPGASRGRGGLGAGSPPRRCRGAGSRGSPGPVRLQAVEHRRSGAERHGTARHGPGERVQGWAPAPPRGKRREGGGGAGWDSRGRAALPQKRLHAWRGVGWGGGRGAGGFLSSALRCHLFPELRTPGLCCSIPEPVVRPPTRAPLTPSAAGWSACVGQAPSLGAAACPGVSGKAVWGSGAEQSPGTRAVCVHTGVQESKGVPREAGGHPSLLWHRNPHGGI